MLYGPGVVSGLTLTFKSDAPEPPPSTTEEGEKLTGHYSGQLGETDLTGTVKGQDVSFKFSVDAQGTMLDFVYAGTVESKDAMKGKVTIVGLGDGTFTAKRQ